MDVPHNPAVPKLWTSTIEDHRTSVREAILDTAWRLVSERGLLGVSMSLIAETAGIGRATLYKYFPDVEGVLIACHERQVVDHLRQLAALRDQQAEPQERLEAVLEAFALISHHRGRHGDADLAALVHRDANAARAEQQVLELIRGLLVEVAEDGQLRRDVAADELARYCLHALSAAGGLTSAAAVRRLVAVVLSGLAAAAVPGR